jgi:hypothetical protein
MVLECRALAWMQLSDALKNEKDVTVMSDGTSKFGHHYESMNVRMTDGRVFSAGVREVSSGSAENMLEVLREIVGDVESLSGGNVAQRVNGVIVKMRNTMGDRASVEKKFNSMLCDFRHELL